MRNFRRLRSGPWGQLALALGLGFVAAAAFSVAIRTEVLRDQYRLSTLRSRESQLREEVEMLRVEESALSATERLERRARALGLDYPTPDRVIKVGRRIAPKPAPLGSGDPR